MQLPCEATHLSQEEMKRRLTNELEKQLNSVRAEVDEVNMAANTQ